jgi:hypothetical protein
MEACHDKVCGDEGQKRGEDRMKLDQLDHAIMEIAERQAGSHNDEFGFYSAVVAELEKTGQVSPVTEKPRSVPGLRHHFLNRLGKAQETKDRVEAIVKQLKAREAQARNG